MIFRYLPVAAALGVLLLHGLLHGTWVGRWTDAGTAEEWAKKLDNIPVSLPSWTSQPLETDPRQIAKAELTGHVSREYIHRLTQERVSVLVVCGQPGPATCHTPYVCYQANGFDVGEITGETVTTRSDGTKHEFQTSVFTKKSAGVMRRLQIYWAWSAGGPWEVPTFLRIHYGTAPAVYKLYFVRDLTNGQSENAANPALDLMQELIPAMQGALFSDTK